MSQKKYLITAALPYANGPLHFGHMAGAYLSADVFNRHKRLQGEKTLFICGSDEHGVAIMLNAKKAGEDYKKYVDGWHADHKKLFDSYGVKFDFFGQTSADYHAEEVVKWFHSLNDKGYIGTQDGQQLFCNDCKNHLPDRFVEGTCYKCGYEHARGDECPNCGELIDSVKLTNTECKICGSNNISEVTVTQYYILMSKYHEEFRKWFEGKSDIWRKTVFPYVDSLTKENLHDRAITRDLDWGIDVPLPNTEGKKLYVWFDAPIGYVSNTKKFLEESGSSEDYLKDWWQNEDVELTHFIGKDNIIFHTIIFPMMSMASGFAKPADRVPANQFLNLEGKQFSKSAGHYVDAHKAHEEFGQTALRYYLLSILPEATDSSFSWEQLQAKVNNELANNIGNFMNRCLKFTQKNWSEGLDAKFFDGFVESEYGQNLKKDIQELNELVDGYQIKKAIEKVMFIGQSANNFFSDSAPWAQIKENKDLAAKTLAYSSIYAMSLGVIMKPFLPVLSDQILNHFEKVLSDDNASRLYKGDIEVIKEIFENGHSVETKVDALVPKIEDELIKQKLSELNL
ncbi:MAG: methionine--tRNA ligase [Oligoflexia bacterium]|nr:methionine--tRNA ligase [Oligoflexia bacterium]